MRHRIRNVISAIYSTPWAILDTKFAEILTFLDRRAQGHLSDGEIMAAAELNTSDGPLVEVRNGVAVINVDGTITHRANFLSDFSGGTSTEMMSGAIRTALRDDQVKSILLRIDSPGGTVPGVPELAKEIMAARGTKPIVAYASPMMASAAYWIGSAADRIVAMPSAEAIGSIGVRMVHVEHSQADVEAGIVRTQLAVPDGKGAINDFTPLSDASRAELMTKINAIYNDFAGAVAAARGVSVAQVKDQFGGGRTFLAGEALQRGLIDSTMTFDELLADLAANSTRPTNVVSAGVPKPAFYRVSESTMNKIIFTALVQRGLCAIDATDEQATAALAKFFADSSQAKPATDLEVLAALTTLTTKPVVAPVAVVSDSMSLHTITSLVSIAPLTAETKLALIGEFSQAKNLSAQQVADRINRAAVEQNAPVGASIRVVKAEADTLREDARDALLSRVWGNDQPKQIWLRTRKEYVDFKPTQGSKAFNISRLPALAKQVAEACGLPSHQVDAMVPADLAQLVMGVGGNHYDGFLTSDQARNVSGMYTNILMDAQYVVLRRGYDEVMPTYTTWTRQGESLPDFKAKNLVTFGQLPDPKAIPENGEFEETTSTDTTDSYKLVNWGQRWSISWEAVVNDSLSAFTRIPAMQGAAMRRKQNRLVYAQLLTNPTMADTGAVFNATAITTAGGHHNLHTGAGAPSVTTLNLLSLWMAEQKGSDTTNGAILNLTPQYIIIPPALRGTVLELLGSTSYVASNVNSNVRNIWAGALMPVIEGELGLAAGGSDVAWYLAAPSSQVDTIEYAFLAGYETPRMDSEVSFDRLGTAMRIYQPFAVKTVDWRGLQKHAGA